MKVELQYNDATDVTKVVVDGVHAGSFSDIDDTGVKYFPANTHMLTGDHFIAIGRALNEVAQGVTPL